MFCTNITIALEKLKERYPNKKIIGKPVGYKGLFVVSMIDKDRDENEPNWDSTVYSVNKETGDIGSFSILDDLNFLTEATPIDERL